MALKLLSSTEPSLLIAGIALFTFVICDTIFTDIGIRYEHIE